VALLDTKKEEGEVVEATVRIGQLSEIVGLHPNWIRKLADEGVIPSEKTPKGHRIFNVEKVKAALSVRAGQKQSLKAGAGLSVIHGTPQWEKSFEIAGLEEDKVWKRIVNDLVLDTSSQVANTFSYAVTEMLNNAIDHSRGLFVIVRFWANSQIWAFEIEDDGQGVFTNLMQGLGLGDRFNALQELSKGKRTTAPSGHSGEGIFFTSKAVEIFQLASDGIRWTLDNIRDDGSVGIEPTQAGTRVSGELSVNTTEAIGDLFRKFSEDHEFVRTRPILKLFEIGVRFMSRSEAKRILSGMEKFTEIEIDFKDVVEVGQGFVDEMLRVWPALHPGQKVIPLNMNEAVEFMVKRGLPRHNK
jgi:hypothetical protein